MSHPAGDLDPEALSQLRALQGPEDPFLLAELIDSFLARTPGALEAMGRQLGNGQGRELELEAHRLRGLCGALGLRRMASLCHRLEDAARRGALEEAPAHLEALREAFTPARAWLAAERAKESAPPAS